MNNLQYMYEIFTDDIMNLTKQKTSKWTFKQNDVAKSSSVWANIWLMTICAYHTVVQGIAPKERAAKEAKQLLNESVTKLEKVLAKAKALEVQLNTLKVQLEEKTIHKQKQKQCKI
jgi:hypothetical protein